MHEEIDGQTYWFSLSTPPAQALSQTLLARLVHHAPPFSSFSRLVSIFVKASCTAHPPYWKGARLSRLSAPSTIAAYSARISNCLIACAFSSLFSSASRRRLWRW